MSVPESPSVVEYQEQGRVAVLRLNRPEARNAVNGAFAQAMEAAIDRMEASPEVWAGVLTANTDGQENPVFCAGADLKAINEGRGAELGTAKGGFAGFAYRERRKPVIAAVDGLATAGGCEIVLACDLVVATSRAAFGLAEVKRNLVAGAGGLYRLPQRVGRNVAMEVILTGNPLSARRAHALGLVNRLVNPGEAEETAMALAAEICENAPLALWESRAVVLAAEFEDEGTLRRMTDDASRVVMRSEDIKEGLNAFIERRPPKWKGR